MSRDPLLRSPTGHRADHAHRLEPSIRHDRRPRAARSRGRIGRSRISGRISLGIGIVSIAIAMLALRPFDGILGAAAGADAGWAVTASAPAGAAGGRDAAFGIGPHGDDVGVRASPGPSSQGPAGSSAPGAEPQALLAGYQWPTHNARITNGYGLGRPGSFVLDGRTFHDGLDLSSFCGARITAAHAGTVLAAGRHHEAYIGWVGDLAPMRAKLDAEKKWGSQAIAVVIDDGNGYRSIYAHLGLASVKAGDVVAAGDLLGYEGASGNATGCHLHYALFNPLETATLTLDPRIAQKSKLPPLEIARIDPLLVLPPLSQAGITWGWGAH